jgi:hypothetical protein
VSTTALVVIAHSAPNSIHDSIAGGITGGSSTIVHPAVQGGCTFRCRTLQWRDIVVKALVVKARVVIVVAIVVVINAFVVVVEMGKSVVVMGTT